MALILAMMFLDTTPKAQATKAEINGPPETIITLLYRIYSNTK